MLSLIQCNKKDSNGNNNEITYTLLRNPSYVGLFILSIVDRFVITDLGGQV
jgi:hypothetical protein